MAFLLAALAVGSAAILVLERELRERAPEVFRALVGYLVIFNLLTSAGLGYRLADLAPTAIRLHLLSAQLVALAALKIVWLGSFIAVAYALARRKVDRRLGTFVAAGSGTALLAAAAGWVQWAVTGRASMTVAVAVATDLVVLAGVVGTAAWLWILAAREPGRDSRRAMRLFSICTLAVMVALGISLATGVVSRRWGGAVQSAAHAAVLVIYELLIVVWAARWASRWAVETPAVPAEAFGRAADRYGLSKREREVAALLCQGRTNKEIADALFVALQTIKDHNSHIFQKVRVRNRTELARKLGEHQEP